MQVSTAVRGIWHFQSWCKYLHTCGWMYADLQLTAVIAIVYSLCCAELTEKDRRFREHSSQQKEIKVFTCLSFLEMCPFLRNVIYQECCYTDVLENAFRTAG